MAENLKDLIARLKQQQAQGNSQMVSQPSNPIPANPIGRPRKEEQLVNINPELAEDFLDEEFSDDMEEPQSAPAIAQSFPKQNQAQNIAPSSQNVNEQIDIKKINEQVASLQNDGVFRLELLTHLDQINDSMQIIAQILVNMSGNGKN